MFRYFDSHLSKKLYIFLTSKKNYAVGLDLYSAAYFMYLQSVQRQATGWTVRGSNPGEVGGRNFPHLSRPELRSTQPPIQWVQVLI